MKLIDLPPSNDEEWDHREATYEGDLIEATEEYIWNKSLKIKGDLDQPLERVQLLGPNIVDAACVALAGTAETVVQKVRQVRFPLDEAATEELDELRERADAARTVFFNAARQVIHTPPSPRQRKWIFGRIA